MIRFIHTGDLHLGLQFNNVSFDVDKANERRLELWHTFSDIVEKAAVEEVDSGYNNSGKPWYIKYKISI